MSSLPDYREINPAPRLSHYVECYWTHADPIGTPRRLVLPDGCVDIIFTSQRGEPVTFELVGLMTRARAFSIPSGQLFFGIRFRPAMATAFLPEAARLNDAIQPVETILGPSGRELFERLSDSRTPDAMAEILDRWLRPVNPPDAGYKALQQLWLSGDSIDSVLMNSGLSARHLRRVCVERAGVSPKYLARLLRFRRAWELVQKIAGNRAQPQWAQLAAACGYFDQAHFIRDFQEFSGQTPGRYLQSLSASSS